MSSIDQLAKEIVKAMVEQSSKKPSAYDTQAEVVRIDGDTAWVHIPGGVDETPVKLTIAAKEGDTVQVRVGGGNAWLTGNASSPPTDDSTANHATYIANEADGKAATAMEESEEAKNAAMTATGYANQAKETAEGIEAVAVQANTNAGIAKTAADKALYSLSDVENVVGVLNWLSEHAVYSLTEDTEVVSGKLYFRRIPEGENIIEQPYSESSPTTINGITFVENNDGSITANGTATAVAAYGIKRQNWTPYLFLDSKEYILSGAPSEAESLSYYMFATHGSNINDQNEQYGKDVGEGVIFTGIPGERTGIWIHVLTGTTLNNVTFNPSLRLAESYETVSDPTGDPHFNGWYERSVDEAVTSYISAHLTLLNDGLYLMLDGSGYRLKLTDDGAYIINDVGKTVAKYSTNAVIGDEEAENILIDSSGVKIRYGENVSANFGETVTIGKTNRIEISDDYTRYYDSDNMKIGEIALGSPMEKSYSDTLWWASNVPYSPFAIHKNEVLRTGPTITVTSRVRKTKNSSLVDYTDTFSNWTPPLDDTPITLGTTIDGLANVTCVRDRYQDYILYLSFLNSSLSRWDYYKSTNGGKREYLFDVPKFDSGDHQGTRINIKLKHPTSLAVLSDINLTPGNYDTYYPDSSVRIEYYRGGSGSLLKDSLFVSCGWAVSPIMVVNWPDSESHYPYLDRVTVSYTATDKGIAYYTFGTRDETQDKGGYSFASGENLIASQPNQVVFGKNNLDDPSKLFILGYGSASTPSNIFSIGINGGVNSRIAGYNKSGFILTKSTNNKSIGLVMGTNNSRGIEDSDGGWLLRYDGSDVYLDETKMSTWNPTVTTSNVTTTTGSVKAISAVQYGKIVQLMVQVYNTSSVASGSPIFDGNLSLTSLRPAIQSNSIGYYVARPIVGYFTPAGRIILRNCGATAATVSESQPLNVTFTYIVN